jgi:monofunctional biosynthetic peptidoglycan transglycosylase
MRDENPKKTAFMKHREEEWKRDGSGCRVQQRWVPLSRISPYVIKAVLVAEDDKFWSHEGFDYEAIQKAIEKDIKARKFKRGASTITQQLAKNLYLSPSKNPVRKIVEAVLTWRLERALTKKRILELYLNVAEWGDAGIFGIEMAARRYYGKSASDIGPVEASRLAAVLPNPRKYTPTGGSRYVKHRADLIYRIMVKRGIVLSGYSEETSLPGEEKDEITNLPAEPRESYSPVTEQHAEIPGSGETQKESTVNPGNNGAYSSSTTQAIP